MLLTLRCYKVSVTGRANDFTSLLSGRLIMYLNALLIFTEHDWSLLIENQREKGGVDEVQ